MNETEEIAKRIDCALPNVKKGSLRFWGDWFGGPYDNCHTLTRCCIDGERLSLFFNQGETLSIWSPRGLSVNGSKFRIRGARSVRWEWFYGRAQDPRNLYFTEFKRSGLRIRLRPTSTSTSRSLSPVCSTRQLRSFESTDYGRSSSTRFPRPTSATPVNPINSPCSTIPGILLRVRASAGGSTIFPKLQSRI